MIFSLDCSKLFGLPCLVILNLIKQDYHFTPLVNCNFKIIQQAAAADEMLVRLYFKNIKSLSRYGLQAFNALGTASLNKYTGQLNLD
jgi:hypothetical protein